MKLGILAAGIVAMASAFSAGAATTVVDLGSYTLSYDDATVLGGMSSNFSSSDGSAGFSWTLPSSINLVSAGGAATSANFSLPDFTITANAGYSLGGPLTGFLGNLERFETVGFANGSSGYFASSATVPTGSFTSFSVKDLVLTLNASGGSFASIIAQPQNELKISFLAAPVPEPETYAMMLAGIGLILTIAQRRKKREA